MTKKTLTSLNRRTFLKGSAALATLPFLPSISLAQGQRLRTAHIGLGAQGIPDLKDIASHEQVDVVALCDVDAKNLKRAQKLFPSAKTFKDYREMLRSFGDQIDAVIVATPDHTHAPASIMAMEMDKDVYCQKPLTHHVTEARKMNQLAKDRGLTTQMGIQVHSFYDYKLATVLIQAGIIGKVHTVRAWSNKNWGFDGAPPKGKDSVPEDLDWNLWLGTAPQRDFKKDLYHPGNWRKVLDYGCGTLGDMGVHIFDTPYNALALDVPFTIKNDCRQPNGFSFPESNQVTYEFPGTGFTADTLTWIWSDGVNAPVMHEDLELPDGDELPDQGAMFLGEKGKLLLPHFMQIPRHIVDGEYQEIDIASYDKNNEFGNPVRNYATESPKHYHQFVDACLGQGECSAPFSYASRLTETILLGTIAGRFPGQTLHWDREKAEFAEKEANQYLDGKYREF